VAFLQLLTFEEVVIIIVQYACTETYLINRMTLKHDSFLAMCLPLPRNPFLTEGLGAAGFLQAKKHPT
jgi:hypothetical protein